MMAHGEFNIVKQRGMTLVEVLIAAGLISIVSLAITGIVQVVFKAQNQANNKNEITLIKMNVRSIIQNDVAWANTVSANPELAACLQTIDPTVGCEGQKVTISNPTDIIVSGPLGHPFELLGTDNSKPYAGYDFKSGPTAFRINTTNGSSVCPDYGGTADEKCAMRVFLTWDPLCPPTGICKRPLIRVWMRFEFSSPDKFNNYNVARLSEVLIRGVENEVSLQQTCESTGATFDPVTKRCNLYATKTCPSGMRIIGYTATGDMNCQGYVVTTTAPTSTPQPPLVTPGTYYPPVTTCSGSKGCTTVPGYTTAPTLTPLPPVLTPGASTVSDGPTAVVPVH